MAGPESTENMCAPDTHFSGLVKSLWRQSVSKSDLCDVTLVVGDNEVKAHWCVLVSCPYFDSVRSSGMSESTSGRVTLIDTTIEAVRAALQHLYLGSDPYDDPQICSGPSAARELMQLADYLQLNRLKQQCASYLARSMAESFDHAHRASGSRSLCVPSGQSSAHGVIAAVAASAIESSADERCEKDAACGIALEFYRLAEMYDAQTLSTAAYREIVRDFEAFAAQPEMMAVDLSMLSGFLTDRNLRYVPARVMFDLLQRWVEHDKTMRAEHFPRLFCSLSLDGIDLDYYDQYIASNPAVLADAGCIRHARQYRRTLRGGSNEGLSGSALRHHRSPAGLSSISFPPAASGGCGDTVDVIVVGGVRLSRLQYAYVIDENRWTSLPTLPASSEGLLGASDGIDGGGGTGPPTNDLAALSRYISAAPLDLIYLEAVVGQRLFALCQELSNSAFSLWELDIEEQRWLSRGNLPLPGSAGTSVGNNAVPPSVLRGYWMTAFSCASKMCFLYALAPAGYRRCALMLACVDVIALADMSSAASPEQPPRGTSGQRQATGSSSAGAGGTESSDSKKSVAAAAGSKDCFELYFNEAVDIRDFRYCVGGSKLYVIVYGLDTERLEDVCHLLIYDVERRRMVEQCKSAPFGDVMYLDRESRVSVQSFGKRFCRIYNSVNKQWKSSRKSVPALPELGTRSDFFSCIHKGNLYVFGGKQDGLSGTECTKYCYTPLKYAPSTSEWERLSDMPLEFSADAEAFPISLPKSMLRCPVDCEHCQQVHREEVSGRDQRGSAERGVRHDANGRARLFGWSSGDSSDDESTDYYLEDDTSRSEDYEEDENDFAIVEANEPDCLLM